MDNNELIERILSIVDNDTAIPIADRIRIRDEIYALKQKVPCDLCNGEGKVQQTDTDWDTCRRCNGSGHLGYAPVPKPEGLTDVVRRLLEECVDIIDARTTGFASFMNLRKRIRDVILKKDGIAAELFSKDEVIRLVRDELVRSNLALKIGEPKLGNLTQEDFQYIGIISSALKGEKYVTLR